MLARLQQLIASTLALLSAFGVVAAFRLDRPALMAIVPIVAMLGYVLALGVEFWLLRRSMHAAIL